MIRMPKKRSIAQRVGEIGEAMFETFATENGLVPHKTKNDYGIDYFCQLTDLLTNRIESVKSSIVGVSVRSCGKERIRSKLNRDDAEVILKSDFPFLVVLVDVKRKIIYHKFVDIEFMEDLYTMLIGESHSFTLTPKIMHYGNSNFSAHLSLVSGKEYRETLRLRYTELRLSRFLGSAKLSVHRDSNGAIAIIQVPSFHCLLDDKADDKAQIRKIFLSTRLDQNLWIPISKKDREIVSEIGDLASKVAIVSPIPIGSFEKVILHNKGKIDYECTFEVRRFEDETSYYHPSGLALIFSDRRKDDDGLYYHSYQVMYGEQSANLLFHYPELVNFLKNCTEGSELRLGISARTPMPIANWAELIRIGTIISDIEVIYKALKITEPKFKLAHLESHAVSFSYAVLAALLHNTNRRDVWPGFLLTDDDVHVQWVPGVIFCPVFLQLAEGPVVIEITFIGRIGLTDVSKKDNPVGFRFDEYNGMHIDFLSPSDLEDIEKPVEPILILNKRQALRMKLSGGPDQIDSPLPLALSYGFDL
jgi:hypothetical protein